MIIMQLPKDNSYSSPININFYEVDKSETLCSKDMMLLLPLNNYGIITINGNRINVTENSIIGVNSFETVIMENTHRSFLIMIINIKKHFFSSYAPKFSSIYFNNHILNDDLSNILKHKIFETLNLLMSSNNYNTFSFIEKTFQIASEILNYYNNDLSYNKEKSKATENRIENILSYIDKNYEKKITLEDLAKLEYMNMNYLSSYFKQNLGVGFNEYLANFRLNKTINELINSNKSINEISKSVGFSSVRSYNRIFNKKYGMTPSTYRANISKNINSNVESEKINNSPLNNNKIHNIISSFNLVNDSNKSKLIIKNLNFNQRSQQILNLENTIYINLMPSLINLDWIPILPNVCDELSIKYVKFRGIFHPGMFYHDKKTNNVSWFNVDNILDKFMQYNVIPFIELYFDSRIYNYSEWIFLAKEFLSHCLERYGIEIMNTWNFEISTDTQEYKSAINLYTKVLSALGKVFKDLRFGILFIPSDDFEKQYYLRNFNNKSLKFMSVKMKYSLYLKKKEDVKGLFENIKKMNMDVFSIYDIDKSSNNDSCLYAGQFIQTRIENPDVNIIMPMMDFFKDTLPFNGGNALLTYTGLKKPIYNAFLLFKKMSGYIIDSSDSCLFTRHNNLYKILLFNNELIDYKNYNNISQNLSTDIHFHLEFTLYPGIYKVKTYILNNQSGSTYKAWIDMGSPEKLSKDDFQYLKSREVLQRTMVIKDVNDSLTLDIQICGMEIKLIELKRIS